MNETTRQMRENHPIAPSIGYKVGAKTRVWDEKKVRLRIIALLTKIKIEEDKRSIDHAGGECPVEASLLWILEKISAGDFYGIVSIQIKGNTTLRPKITEQSLRLHTELSNYLL